MRLPLPASPRFGAGLLLAALSAIPVSSSQEEARPEADPAAQGAQEEEREPQEEKQDAPGRQAAEAGGMEIPEGELIDLETGDALPPREGVLELALADALRIAMERNLDLEIQRLATERARFDALGSWGAFDPIYSLGGSYRDAEIPLGSQSQQGFQVSSPVLSVDTQAVNTSLFFPVETGGSFSLAFDRSNTDNSGSVLTSDTLTLNLSQPLLRGAWSSYATADQRQAEISHEREIQSEHAAVQRMLLDVYVAYWDLVSAREELRVREQAVALGLRQLAQDERRLEVGAGTEVDVLQSQTNLSQQLEQRINAQFVLRSAEDAVRRLIFQHDPEEGQERYLVEWDWPIVPLTELPTGEPDTPQLSWITSLDRAIRHRPELWQSRLDIESSEVALERATSERLPQLDLGFNLDSQGEDIDPSESLEQAFEFELLSMRTSLDFSVPVWNRTRAYAVRSARSNLRSARLAYDRQELDILTEVRSAVRDLVFSVEAVEAATTSFRLARRQFEAEQARREIGLSTTFQVLEFQQDLVEARSAELTARANWMKSRAALGFSEGVLSVDPTELDDAEGP